MQHSEKLYKIEVDLGRERRTLVAGIKKFYSKEELAGKRVVVLCNLKPKKILGITSHGMLLACETREGRIALLTCDAEKGSEVYAEGVGRNPSGEISLEEFLSLDLEAREGKAYYGNKLLIARGKAVVAEGRASGKIR